MTLLKDEHRPQSNGRISASSHVHTAGLGLLDDRVSSRAIPSQEGTSVLASQVVDLVGVFLRELLQLSVEVLSDLGCVLDKAESVNLAVDASEEQSPRGVTHPGVELSVGLVGPQGGIAEEVASGLGLLGEGHHVGRCLEVPVLMRPELARGSNTSLDLVDNHEDVLALGDLAKALEEGG